MVDILQRPAGRKLSTDPTDFPPPLLRIQEKPPPTARGLDAAAASAGVTEKLNEVYADARSKTPDALGRVPEGSDLDLLIVSYPRKTWGQVRSAVDDAARPARAGKKR